MYGFGGLGQVEERFGWENKLKRKDKATQPKGPWKAEISNMKKPSHESQIQFGYFYVSYHTWM